MSGVVAPCHSRTDAGADRDAGGGKAAMAAAGDLRIGIFERRNNLADPGRDDRIGAGRSLSVMGAGLERDVERRTTRPSPARSSACVSA